MLQSTLDLNSIVPPDGQLTSNNRQVVGGGAPFFMGQDGTLGGADMNATGNNTHLKIAQLFKTTVNSSVDTQVDEQIRRLEVDDTVNHNFTSCGYPNEASKQEHERHHRSVEQMGCMADYFRKQTLISKSFSALKLQTKKPKPDRYKRDTR